jgi:hypothetical protein
MAGPSLEDIQEEFADLDLPITDDEVLERLQVWIFVKLYCSVNLYIFSWKIPYLPILLFVEACCYSTRTMLFI